MKFHEIRDTPQKGFRNSSLTDYTCVSHDILHTIIGRRKPVYIFLFDVKFTTFEIMEITLPYVPKKITIGLSA